MCEKSTAKTSVFCLASFPIAVVPCLYILSTRVVFRVRNFFVQKNFMIFFFFVFFQVCSGDRPAASSRGGTWCRAQRVMMLLLYIYIMYTYKTIVRGACSRKTTEKNNKTKQRNERKKKRINETKTDKTITLCSGYYVDSPGLRNV